jgi:hypothetical protein
MSKFVKTLVLTFDSSFDSKAIMVRFPSSNESYEAAVSVELCRYSGASGQC